MISRLKQWGGYLTDNFTLYRMLVSVDHLTTASLAWTINPALTVPRMPQGFHPRYLSLLSPTTGKRDRIIAPDPTGGCWRPGPFWNPLVTTMDVKANDNTIDVMDIIAYINERPSLP
jgi:hypothetical protein